MRISKFLPMICAMGICANFISVRAQDNPAQAAARAALLEKMNEMSEPTNPAPPIGITPSGAEAEQAPASMPTNPPVTPSTTEPEMNVNSTAPATGSDTEAQAAARAALMEKMNEMSEPTNPPVEIQPALASNPAMTPPAENPPAMTNVAVAPMSSQSESTMQENKKAQKEAAAAEKKRAKAEKEAAKAAEKSPAISQSSTNSVNNPAVNSGFTPMESPPLPISADKQMQLQTLDAKYKADQITPEEYFKQREAILGATDGTNQ